MFDGIRFPEEIHFRAPSGLENALDEAAKKNLTTRSDYIRRALAAMLRKDEVTVTPRYITAEQS